MARKWSRERSKREAARHRRLRFFCPLGEMLEDRRLLASCQGVSVMNDRIVLSSQNQAASFSSAQLLQNDSPGAQRVGNFTAPAQGTIIENGGGHFTYQQDDGVDPQFQSDSFGYFAETQFGDDSIIHVLTLNTSKGTSQACVSGFQWSAFARAENFRPVEGSADATEITFHMDRSFASQGFVEAVTSGSLIVDAKLVSFDKNRIVPLAEWKMDEVVFTSYDLAGSGTDRPFETLRASFDKLTLTRKVYGDKGNLTVTSTSGYDFEKGASIADSNVKFLPLASGKNESEAEREQAVLIGKTGKFDGALAIAGFSFGVIREEPPSVSDPAPPPISSDVTVFFDSTGPSAAAEIVIFDSLVNGRRIDELRLSTPQSAGDNPQLGTQYILTEAFVTSWQTQQFGDTAPTNSVTFGFSALQAGFQPLNEKGDGGTLVLTKYDFADNRHRDTAGFQDDENAEKESLFYIDVDGVTFEIESLDWTLGVEDGMVSGDTVNVHRVMDENSPGAVSALLGSRRLSNVDIFEFRQDNSLTPPRREIAHWELDGVYLTSYEMSVDGESNNADVETFSLTADVIRRTLTDDAGNTDSAVVNFIDAKDTDKVVFPSTPITPGRSELLLSLDRFQDDKTPFMAKFDSFNWSVDAPRTGVPGEKGFVPGSAENGAFSLTVPAGLHSTGVQDAIVAGTSFPKLTLSLYNGNDPPEEFERWTLHDVVFESYFRFSSKGNDNPAESFTVTSDKVEWMLVKADGTGKLIPTTTSWDFENSKAFAGTGDGAFPLNSKEYEAVKTTDLFLRNSEGAVRLVSADLSGALNASESRVEFSDLGIAAETSGVSIDVFNAITRLSPLGDLSLSNGRGNELSHELDLTTNFVTSFHVGRQRGGNPPIDNWTLAFDQITARSADQQKGFKAQATLLLEKQTGQGDTGAYGTASSQKGFQLNIGSDTKLKVIPLDGFNRSTFSVPGDMSSEPNRFSFHASDTQASPALLLDLINQSKLMHAAIVQRSIQGQEIVETDRWPLPDARITSAGLAFGDGEVFEFYTIESAPDQPVKTPNFGNRLIRNDDGSDARVRGTVFVVPSGTDNLTISTPLTRPNAVNDVATTKKNVPVVIDVLANDSDPEGDQLMIVGVSDSLQGTVVNHGTHITFTPNVDFTGSAFIIYDLSDGNTFNPPQAFVTVTVEDADVTPIFLDNAAVDEATDGATVGNLSVPEGTITVSSYTVDDQRFEVSGSTLKLKAGQSLDFETARSVTVNVTANPTTGVADPPQPMTIIVRDVNEFDPVLSVSAITDIPEFAVDNTFVGRVQATDGDTAQRITYSIITGNDDGLFAIDPNDGDFGLVDSSTIDFETTPFYVLTFQATDNGTPPRSGTLELTVHVADFNEFAPVVDDSIFSIDENPGFADFVGTPTFTDEDGGMTVASYEIIDGNLGNAFAIDSATGEITVNNPFPIDHEVHPQFELTLKVTDTTAPPRFGVGTVTIDVADVNDPPVPGVNGPFAIDAGAALSVDASLTTDQDNEPSFTFSWDLDGDSNEDFRTSNALDMIPWSTLSGLNLGTGTHVIDLTVFDPQNASGTISAELIISDRFVYSSLLSGRQDNLSDATALVQQNGRYEIRGGLDGPLLSTTLAAGINRALITGSADDDHFTIDVRNSSPVPSQGAHFDGGDGSDTFTIGGQNFHLDLTDSSGVNLTDIEVINITGNSPNELTFNSQSVSSVTDANNQLTILADADDTINVLGDWHNVGQSFEDGIYFQRITDGFSNVKIAPPAPWQNIANPADIDGDGRVIPLDVILLINDFNEFEAGALDPVAAGALPYLFLDPTGDNHIFAEDVIFVINAVNERLSPMGIGGEGEMGSVNANSTAALFSPSRRGDERAVWPNPDPGQALSVPAFATILAMPVQAGPVQAEPVLNPPHQRLITHLSALQVNEASTDRCFADLADTDDQLLDLWPESSAGRHAGDDDLFDE